MSAVVAVCNAKKNGQRHVLARGSSRDGVPGLEIREAINAGKGVVSHWRFVPLPEDEILGVTLACPCGGGKDFHATVSDLWRAYRDGRVVQMEPWDKMAHGGSSPTGHK